MVSLKSVLSRNKARNKTKSAIGLYTIPLIGVWIDTYVFYQSVLQKKDLNLVIVCRKDVTS